MILPSLIKTVPYIIQILITLPVLKHSAEDKYPGAKYWVVVEKLLKFAFEICREWSITPSLLIRVYFIHLSSS